MWLILHLGEVGEWLVAFGRRWGLLPALQPISYDPPVERIAADLRRLHAAVEYFPPGTTNTRRRALLKAYDETLMAGCRALDLPQRLLDLPPGVDRDIERMRVETALEAAGLRFRPVTW
jgi:hypothetical protein